MTPSGYLRAFQEEINCFPKALWGSAANVQESTYCDFFLRIGNDVTANLFGLFVVTELTEH